MPAPDSPHAPPPLPLGRYRHFKGGEYDALDLARDSEAGHWVVVYRALYGGRGLWVRPLAMFTEVIERDGVKQQRFTYVGTSQVP